MAMTIPHVLLILKPTTLWVKGKLQKYRTGQVFQVLKLDKWEDAADDIHLENGDVLKEFDKDGNRVAVLLETGVHEMICEALTNPNKGENHESAEVPKT